MSKPDFKRQGTCVSCGATNVETTHPPMQHCVDLKQCEENRRKNVAARTPPKWNILRPARVMMKRAGRPYYMQFIVAHVSQHKDNETGVTYDIQHAARIELTPDMREGTVFKPAEAMKIAEAWGGVPVEVT